MQSLNFNDGFKEFMINNDPDRVIRFNPADFSILERFQEASERITSAQEDTAEGIEVKADGTVDSELDEAVEMIAGINKLIKDQVDYIFDSKVSDIAFGNQSPLSMVKGAPLFERFIEAAQKHIEKEIMAEQKASQKRIEKYTKVYHK